MVDIYWDAETTYRYPNGQTAYETILNNRLSLAAQQGFVGIKTAASSDFNALFSRVSLDQGTSGAAGKVETVSRLLNLAQNGDIASDPELLTLMYNYGRYLLISSARANALPPNLQGVWNNNFNPPWGSKFTIDINLQMNSWLADPMQLSETLSPLWELMQLMQNRGKQVASDMYGSGGWMCHHNTDLWGDCAPADCGSAWTPWPMGAAWILNHASEHYRYTQNATFARQTALPLLSDALSFYYDFAIFKNGHRVTWPSLSPENEYQIDSSRSNAGQTTGLDEGSQMDRALLWDLFNGFIELSQATGSTTGVAKAQEFLGQIEGPTISQNTGRLMEWSIDYEEIEAGHRHFSPLFGLHPGHQYSPLYNQTIFNAALKLLNHRMDSGSGSTGWSRIWAASLYARSFMGDTALSHISTLMKDYIFF
jgi:hypothetical protein